MKKKFKFLSAALILAVGLGLFACGEEGVTPDSTDESIESDFASLAGNWFLDGEADSYSSLEIDEHGNWTLYESSDGDMTEVDCGTIRADSDDHYFATSTKFDDVEYDFTVVDDGVMYWGGENDYYAKLS